MNKIDVWKKYELLELFADLETASKILAEVRGGYSANFISAENFYEALEDELYDLEHQNVPDFRQICIWFAPTSAWDDFVGIDAMNLANSILERAKRWNETQL